LPAFCLTLSAAAAALLWLANDCPLEPVVWPLLALARQRRVGLEGFRGPLGIRLAGERLARRSDVLPVAGDQPPAVLAACVGVDLEVHVDLLRRLARGARAEVRR